MKKIIRIICFATLLLSGCTVNELENPQNIVGDFPTFYASFGDAADETTKTYVDEKMTLRWTEDDRLSIFVGNTFNREYKYDGETGANNGSFSAISSPEFVSAEPLDANYAVYPYNASNEMSKDGSMSVVLPSVQKYAENSFGLGANTMVAATENKEDNFLQFKNLCGYVVVKLYGDGTVTSIKLEGNDGEKISGKADVQVAYGILPSVTMSEEATTSITLDCGEGVTLGTTAETATEFWFCVPPLTFSKGFTITATKTDGWQMIKSTSSSKEVVRNTMNALTPIEAVFNIPPVDTVPPDDEIWYVTKDNKIIDLDRFDELFDVNVISHTYSNGKGIIKCDGPIKVLKRYALNWLSFNQLFLPNSIEVLQEFALYGIDVSQLRIPDNLEFVDNRALKSPYLEKFTGKNVSDDGRCVIIEDGYAKWYNGHTETIIPIEGNLAAFAPAGISSYTIPDNAKYLGQYVFAEYDGLREIRLNEGLESICSDCFFNTHFDCDIVLPQSLNYLDSYAFHGCYGIKGFYGNDKFHTADNRCLVVDINDCQEDDWKGLWLIKFAGEDITDYVIPEGIKCIENYAFDGLNNLRSITFPSSIVEIAASAVDNCPSMEAVYGDCTSEDHKGIVFGTQYRTLIVPNGIKDYKVPEGITSLGLQAFENSPDLETVTMSDDVTELVGYDFAFCNKLKKVVLSARLNYAGHYNPFLNYPERTNLEEVYFRSPVPPIYHDTQFYEMPKVKMYVPRQSLELYLTSPDWAQFRQYFEPYDYDDLPDDVLPDYYTSTDYSADGTVHTVQTASIGKGANLVLMGDAFSDRQIADGTYNNVIQKAINALFSEEPYKSYKNYFNVYSVDAVSMTEGYEHGGQVFGTGHGEGTYVYGNDEKVFEYAQKALTVEQMDDALIIVMMNEDAYAGTCFMYDPNSGDYGRGAAIAYFPTSSDTDTFNGLVSHEAGGHGFAKLADEYAYEYMGAISYGEMEGTKSLEPYGWYKNVDFTSDPTLVKWSKFLSDERYANEGLGCFEGGLTYWSGVWRPTDYSIMRYNTGGFNAPSREAIWYRIHKLAYGEEWQYNYEDFVTYDAINRTPAAQAASRAKVKAAAAARKGKPFQPLHEPVVVKRSWKEAVNNPGKDGR